MGFYQTYGGRPVSQQIEVTEEKRNVYDDCNRLTDRWYHTSFSPSTLCLVLYSVWYFQSYLTAYNSSYCSLLHSIYFLYPHPLILPFGLVTGVVSIQ